MTSVSLNLLKLDLWPQMCSILENVPYELEKKIYFASFGWNVLQISVRSTWSNVSFKACMFLQIFCLDDFSIGVIEGLKIPYYHCVFTVDSPFYVCQHFLYVLQVLLCWLHIYLQFMDGKLDGSIDHYVVSLLFSFNILYFKVHFV